MFIVFCCDRFRYRRVLQQVEDQVAVGQDLCLMLRDDLFAANEADLFELRGRNDLEKMTVVAVFPVLRKVDGCCHNDDGLNLSYNKDMIKNKGPRQIAEALCSIRI